MKPGSSQPGWRISMAWRRGRRFPALSGAGPGAAGEPVVVAFGERGGGLGVARQQRQESVEFFLVEAEARRELPQQGPQLLFQPQYPLREEIGERRLDLAQLFHMGD